MKDLFKSFIVVAFGLIMIIYNTISWGYASFKLYRWFIVPYFNELPMFSVFQFMGFHLFFNCLIKPNYIHLKSEYEDSDNKIFTYVLSPWWTLFTGYLVSLIFF